MKEQIEDDEDKVVRDGQRLVVSMLMMDSLQRSVAVASAAPPAAFHKPTAVSISDEQRTRRASTYQGYDATLGERWKDPSTAKPAEADQAAAYATYDAKIGERWRAA